MAGAEVRKQAVSDLPVRLGSAVVMLVISAGALWLGGWFWTAFVGLLALGVLWEWNRLVSRFGVSGVAETLWFFGGVIYIGGAALAMLALRNGAQFLPVDGQSSGYAPFEVLVSYILPIVAVDVGAYFAGRAIGGPKIAPKISPSKTWAGLGGGVLAALVLGFALHRFAGLPIQLAAASGLLAVAAQAGDLLESGMKRRAGVKDSGNILPGHGGVMDRLDGVVAAAPLAALLVLMLGLD